MLRTVLVCFCCIILLTIPSLHNWAQTIADRVVEQVDEALKADIMHWAAIYVCHVIISQPTLEPTLVPRDSRLLG